jgi:hypothetical protein
MLAPPELPSGHAPRRLRVLESLSGPQALSFGFGFVPRIHSAPFDRDGATSLAGPTLATATPHPDRVPRTRG